MIDRPCSRAACASALTTIKSSISTRFSSPSGSGRDTFPPLVFTLLMGSAFPHVECTQYVAAHVGLHVCKRKTTIVPRVAHVIRASGLNRLEPMGQIAAPCGDLPRGIRKVLRELPLPTNPRRQFRPACGRAFCDRCGESMQLQSCFHPPIPESSAHIAARCVRG